MPFARHHGADDQMRRQLAVVVLDRGLDAPELHGQALRCPGRRVGDLGHDLAYPGTGVLHLAADLGPLYRVAAARPGVSADPPESAQHIVVCQPFLPSP